MLRYYQGLCKLKAQQYRLDETGLVEELEALTRRAQDSPSDHQAFQNRGASRARLEAYRDRQAEGRRIRS